MPHITTDELLKQLRSANSIPKLTKYTSNLSFHTGYRTFAEYMTAYLKEHDLPQNKIIQASLIQRNYGYQILNGSKNPGREKILALCLAAGMNYEETQRALTLAGLGKLYPRRKEDSVIIFAIENKLNVLQTNELLYEECGKIL